MDVVDAAHQGRQDAGVDGEAPWNGPGRQPARRQARAVAPRSPRRVREDVRDGVAVIAFSALMSLVMAMALILLTRLVD
jgi:hypothetical protein